MTWPNSCSRFSREYFYPPFNPHNFIGILFGPYGS
jgi:hypothetical protein